MTPFAILTRMRFGADWNHLSIPSYLALFGCAILLPSLLSRLLNHDRALPLGLFACGTALCLYLAAAPYLQQSFGWYLWPHNPQNEALRYETSSSERIYFPWQVFPMLLAEGKLYHLDDCLRYEAAAGWKRPADSLKKFLPREPYQIAIRPFGASSYIAKNEHYVPGAASPLLEDWRIYKQSR